MAGVSCIIPPVSYNPEPPTAAFSNTTRFNQEMLNTREDDEAWLSNLATNTYETEATQKASNTTTPHWQRQYYESRQETINVMMKRSHTIEKYDQSFCRRSKS